MRLRGANLSHPSPYLYPAPLGCPLHHHLLRPGQWTHKIKAWQCQNFNVVGALLLITLISSQSTLPSSAHFLGNWCHKKPDVSSKIPALSCLRKNVFQFSPSS
eukprot:1138409-Pelagomonas_calceolata.AAC.5